MILTMIRAPWKNLRFTAIAADWRPRETRHSVPASIKVSPLCPSRRRLWEDPVLEPFVRIGPKKCCRGCVRSKGEDDMERYSCVSNSTGFNAEILESESDLLLKPLVRRRPTL